MPHKEAYEIKNEVEFFRAVRSNLIKTTVIREVEGIEPEVEMKAKELIAKSIAAEGVIDIFALRGKEKAEISVLNEKFLEEIRKMEYKNLAIETLEKLLRDEIQWRIRKNLFRYKSLRESLEKVIEEYENRVISATKVIEKLIELAKELKKKENEGKEIGLSEEELAFYDALATQGKLALKNGEIKSFVKELVREIRRDITIDWTNNEIIKSRIKAKIKLLLAKRKVPIQQISQFTELLYLQAENLFRDYVRV
jgi:type I restriction enzyme R subunit